MAKFSENRHISDLINMSCKVVEIINVDFTLTTIRVML